MMIYKRRTKAYFCSMILICCGLILRLYNLGTGNNPAMQVLSGQYLRKNTVAEHKGFVYDRNGVLMSARRNGYLAVINPSMSRDKNHVINFLAGHSDTSEEEISALYEKNTPFIINVDEMAESDAFEGIYTYPAYTLSENSILRHILGYRKRDETGVTGIYGRFDDLLSSYGGSLSYTYSSDALGGVLYGESFNVDNAGYTDLSGIVLTVDSEIQIVIDAICDKYIDMGTVVVSELSTGNIVAISSRPLYDARNVSSSLDSERGELINRAFALYTPGSVFKAVVAAAALEYDINLYLFEYECTGECDVSGKIFKCHKKDGHGVQNMKSAFANSCNTYFIKLAEKTGFEYICLIAKQMGVGSINVIDGMYVKEANMPDLFASYPDAYKANFAFGQGDLLLSPIDVLNIYSICATGIKRDFSLLYGLYDGSSDRTVTFEFPKGKRILNDATVYLLRLMMRECVLNGTGNDAYSEGIDAGGKTATAQSGQYKNGKEILHRWFAGIYPVNDPKYAIVVLCDGNGENKALPVEIFAMCIEALSKK